MRSAGHTVPEGESRWRMVSASTAARISSGEPVNRVPAASGAAEEVRVAHGAQRARS